MPSTNPSLPSRIRGLAHSPSAVLRSLSLVLQLLATLRQPIRQRRLRSELLTRLRFGQSHFQGATHTQPNRYPILFEQCRTLLTPIPQPRILSFGCSTGEEVFTLANLIPNAHLLGTDINPWCLRQAQAQNQNPQIQFLHPTSPAFQQAPPFDAIFALAVFQRTENSQASTLTQGFRFADFEQALTLLDHRLNPGGILFIDQADFRFTDTHIATRYQPLTFPHNERPRTRPLFDRHNTRITTQYTLPRAFRKLTAAPPEPTTQIIAGLQNVLTHLPALAPLAQSTAQQDELADLPYILSRPSRLHHKPILILLFDPPGQIAGAVILYEFQSVLRGLRLFSCYSRRGLRTIFAPPTQRASYAAIAAQALITRGARFVNIQIPFGDTPNTPLLAGHLERTILPHLHAPAEYAFHLGVKRSHLPLYPDLDRTLAPLGSSTRRNLHRYQRLTLSELNCLYQPNAQIDLPTFLALNRQAHYRVSQKVAEWRYHSLTRFPNTFLAGLQDPSGQWLSLIAGRRSHGAVTIDWQMNRTGYKRFSLATAARACLIQHECRTGSTSLALEGGALQFSILDFFTQHTVANLALRRPSTLLRLLERILLRFYPKKYLTIAFSKPWRTWQPAPPQPLPAPIRINDR